MGKHKTTKKEIKDLEIKKAYAEYKIRYAGDLDSEFDNWVNNLTIAIKRANK